MVNITGTLAWWLLRHEDGGCLLALCNSMNHGSSYRHVNQPVGVCRSVIPYIHCELSCRVCRPPLTAQSPTINVQKLLKMWILFYVFPNDNLKKSIISRKHHFMDEQNWHFFRWHFKWIRSIENICVWHILTKVWFHVEINSLRLSDPKWWHKAVSVLAQVMAQAYSIKPLPEPMLT